MVEHEPTRGSDPAVGPDDGPVIDLVPEQVADDGIPVYAAPPAPGFPPSLSQTAEAEEDAETAQGRAPARRLWSAALRGGALLAIVGGVLWLLFRPQASPAPAAAEELNPTPTGLAAVLAVVNPDNVPTATPTTAAAGRGGLAVVDAGLADAAAGGAAQGTSGAAGSWPFDIEIVTPTPRPEEAILLFADPLVAEATAEPVQVRPSVLSTDQPVILPALAAAAAGGNPVAAPALDTLVQPRIVPALEIAPIPDRITPTVTPEPVATVPPIALQPGRAWAGFTPGPESTHFWVERPFPASVENQLAAPSYQFGSTGGNRYRAHHGMDIANNMGTPVRAATTGEVIHAGPDDPDLLGPYNNFYGNAVVIRLDQRLAVAGGELDVFLLYGHLSQVNVSKGQRVQPDDIVGAVGMTGIAIGPHLHVEMRVGANTYENSVNPYLWVEPLGGGGAVAVRLLNADGRTWPRARVTLARFEGNIASWARVMEIYPDDESINPNPAWGENGAMESVPPGNYYVVAVVNGERVAAEITVNAGQTTFVELRTKQ
jgi:murein DD-endopeptidase MepM/ murein hydrolase activator NlpD